jgi:hypothetical protein
MDDEFFCLERPLLDRSDILRSLNNPEFPDGVLTIPAGFVTDFSSVPRVPIVYMLFGDRAHHESVPHDYLYQTHLVSKSVADRVFLEAMQSRGKSAFIRNSMYLGVVLGGGSSYKSGPERMRIFNNQSPIIQPPGLGAVRGQTIPSGGPGVE